MFEVQPYSIDYYGSGDVDKICKAGNAQPLDLVKVTDKRKVTYTYSVDWQLSKTTWANRWRALPSFFLILWCSIHLRVSL